MSIIADINSLEQRVQAILDAAGNYGAVDNYADAYIRQIMAGLENITTSTDPETIRRLVKDAIAESQNVLNIELTQAMQSDVNSLIDETINFYADQGLKIGNIMQAMQGRQDFRALNRLFTSNLSGMETELFDGTIEVMEMAIQTGQINRAQLAKDIEEVTKSKAHYADTNARLLVSGYNRMARLEMRDSAGLDHGYYYGSVLSNTRPFCGLMVGKVLSIEQIRALDNGQGLDVETFCGGYNCIHSWMWVVIAWDQMLKDRLYTGTLQTISEGKKSIIVPAA